MRTLITLMALVASPLVFAQSRIEIPADQSVLLSYPDQTDLSFELENTSGMPLEISVVNKVSGEQISGFGLGPEGNAGVSVCDICLLKVTNYNTKTASLRYRTTSYAPVIEPETKFISFQLQNETNTSIPLVIPGVMNPNLSPNSFSGVRLKVGQKVYYSKTLKKSLILTVSDDIAEGDTVKVGALVQNF